MICEQDVREKTEILVKLLLLFSIIVFNMMNLLVQTFVIKLFAQINVLKKVYLPFLCNFSHSKFDEVFPI